MLRNKMTFLHGVRILLTLLLFTIVVSVVLAQTTVPTDPGPRPVGNNNPFCPPTAGAIQSAKFPTAPPCIDTVQPPDTIGDGGAGNVVSFSSNLAGFWFQALAVFEVNAVVGPEQQTGGSTFPGLGPSFNAVSCFQCHSQPTVGGSAPGLTRGVPTPGFPNGNPQVGDAPTPAQLQAVSSFISATGPVREARFPNGAPGDDTIHRDPVPAGSVANLFVIKGRPDAPANCDIAQDDFPTQVTNKNIIFRIPIPTFGEGFVENTTDDNLEGNLNTEDAIANNPNIFNPVLGITGSFNISGNDQTISRFGWKAQNKSLLIFSGEAANVEMGVTNENFPNERTDGNGQCSPNPEPEDQVIVPPDPTDPNPNRDIISIFNNPNFGASGVASLISSDIENFAVFMRLNASPSQCNYNSAAGVCAAFDNSAKRGAKLFGSLDPTVAGSLTSSTPDTDPNTSGLKPIGCVLCHSNFLRTTTSLTRELNNAVFHPFSDFAIHTMDSGLADGVTQGNAGPNQFRTAPLWGLGQRLFFLHDGRATDVLTAIKQHAPNAGTSPANCTPAMGEACQVIVLFNKLSPTSQQDILNFLRSL